MCDMPTTRLYAHPRTARLAERNCHQRERTRAVEAGLATSRQAAEYAARIARIQATPPGERPADDVLVLFAHQVTVGIRGVFAGHPYFALAAALANAAPRGGAGSHAT